MGRPPYRKDGMCLNGHALTPENVYIERISEDRSRVRCRECMRRRGRQFQNRHRERWRQEHRVKARRWQERNPDKVRAHRAVARALQRGRLVRPERCERCERCDNLGPLHAHHENYQRLLDIQWLCRACHGTTYRA